MTKREQRNLVNVWNTETENIENGIMTVKRERFSFAPEKLSAQQSIADDFGMLFMCTTEQLMSMSKEMLVQWALIIGVSTSGNKKDLVHNIAEWVSVHRHDADKLAGNHMSIFPTLYGYVTADDLMDDDKAQAFIFDYLVQADMTTQLARAVVCSIARSRGFVKGKEACIQLRNNGFREEIFEDIKQEVSLEVWKLICGKLCYLSDGIATFAHNSFSRLFGAVYRTLKDYKWADDSQALADYVSLFEKDEDGNEQERVIKLNDSNAVPMLSQIADIGIVEKMEWFKSFKAYCKDNMREKKYERSIDVLALFAMGLSQERIAGVLNVSWDTVHRSLLELRTLAVTFDKDITGKAFADTKQFGCISRPASYNDRVSYTVGNMTGYKPEVKPVALKACHIDWTTGELNEFTYKVKSVRVHVEPTKQATWKTYDIPKEFIAWDALIKARIADGTIKM